MGNFTQISLDEWQAGPYLVIGGIRPEPPELHKSCQVNFDTIQEDLGLEDIAFLMVEDETKLILTRYKKSAGVGTEVWGLANTPDKTSALLKFVSALGLEESAVLWVSEE